ncbi:MAG: haloacid dehalogenase, type II [Acidobacteria bacterium RIFCSPLOWO2_12_FULL_54_10]|nr:MAG: haloacid dehalogenase, type II [Acidobacteria bacterium RIFCSPLOWO2_12_FULL_54_10]
MATEQGKIQAVVFDAYGTLFNPYTAQPQAEKLFPGKGTELTRLWRSKQLEYTWLRSLMQRYEDFWEVTRDALVFSCQSLKLECSEQAIQGLLQTYLDIEAYPEVEQALRELKGRRLAILSNGTPGMLQAAIESTDLEGVFAQVISVDAAKTYKTDPRVYQLAPDKLGVAKSAIAFVSSNYWDAAGAKAFGFWTCWVNRSGAPPEVLGVKPDAVVKSLAELQDVLPR